jgi:hypothetical protein
MGEGELPPKFPKAKPEFLPLRIFNNVRDRASVRDRAIARDWAIWGICPIYTIYTIYSKARTV